MKIGKLGLLIAIAFAFATGVSSGVIDGPMPLGKPKIGTAPGVTFPNSGLCSDWEEIYENGPVDGYFCTIDWEPTEVRDDGCRVHAVHCVGPRGYTSEKSCLDGPAEVCGKPAPLIF